MSSRSLKWVLVSFLKTTNEVEVLVTIRVGCVSLIMKSRAATLIRSHCVWERLLPKAILIRQASLMHGSKPSMASCVTFIFRNQCFSVSQSLWNQMQYINYIYLNLLEVSEETTSTNALFSLLTFSNYIK